MGTYNETSELLAFGPRTCSANTTVNGTTLDRRGSPYFHDLSFVALAGAITDGTHHVIWQESPDGSTWTNIADADLVGGVNNPTLSANTVTSRKYKGTQPYVRMTLVTTGATSGGLFSGIVIQSRPRVTPAR